MVLSDSYIQAVFATLSSFISPTKMQLPLPFVKLTLWICLCTIIISRVFYTYVSFSGIVAVLFSCSLCLTVRSLAMSGSTTRHNTVTTI